MKISGIAACLLVAGGSVSASAQIGAAHGWDVHVVPAMDENQAEMPSVSLSWMTITSLSSRTDQVQAKTELNELYSCDNDPSQLEKSSCEDARVALVPLIGGGDLLLVRYPQWASCAVDFSVYGPADGAGHRRHTETLCGERLIVVQGQGSGGWPDLRLFGFRCGFNVKLSYNIYCRDGLFRWSGKEWKLIEMHVAPPLKHQ